MKRLIFLRVFNMIIAIPCAAGFIVLAKPLLDLLFFTENNTLGGVLLQMGAISVVFYNLSTVTNAVLQGLDNMMVPVKKCRHLSCYTDGERGRLR